MMVSTMIEIPEAVYEAMQKLLSDRKDLDLNTCFAAAMAAYLVEAAK